MKKFECHGCDKHHVVECEEKPVYCLFSGFDVSRWREVTEEKPPKLTAEEPKLPSWCKVGAWVYICDGGVGKGKYYKIDSIINRWINFEKNEITMTVNAAKSNLSEARIRPWTPEEAIGKITCWEGDFKGTKNTAMITGIDADGNVGGIFGMDSLSNIAKYPYFQPDGSPCGILEHFDANIKEWVK